MGLIIMFPIPKLRHPLLLSLLLFTSLFPPPTVSTQHNFSNPNTTHEKCPDSFHEPLTLSDHLKRTRSFPSCAEPYFDFAVYLLNHNGMNRPTSIQIIKSSFTKALDLSTTAVTPEDIAIVYFNDRRLMDALMTLNERSKVSIHGDLLASMFGSESLIFNDPSLVKYFQQSKEGKKLVRDAIEYCTKLLTVNAVGSDQIESDQIVLKPEILQIWKEINQNLALLVETSVEVKATNTASFKPLQERLNSKVLIRYTSRISYMLPIFTKVFPLILFSREVVIEGVTESNIRDGSKVDIIIACVLDGRNGLSWGNYLLFFRKNYPAAKIILVSGEVEDLRDAKRFGADLVIGTTDEYQPQGIPYIYLPTAATGVGQILNITQYLDLGSRKGGDLRERKFCAYMYSICHGDDRKHREHFYNILKKKALAIGQSVDALGVCGGSDSKTIPSRRSNRYAENFHDDAVQIYKDYAFVISFENNMLDGYYTEKIITPMLAGSIPLYLGGKGVERVFNVKSFVNCGDKLTFEDLEACADYAIDLWNDTSNRGELERMSQEEFIVDDNVLQKEFGSQVGKGRLVDELSLIMTSWEIA